MQGKLSFKGELPLARKRDPETSKIAARSFNISRKSQRFTLLEQFVKDQYSGGRGVSDEDAAMQAQLPRLDSGHKRAAELRRDGLIMVVGEVMGKHGTPVRVCTATQAGCTAYEQAKQI